MLRCAALVLAAGLVLSAPAGRAQEAVVQRLEIQRSGEAYLRSIRFRGVDPDVAYFDPSAPPPALDTRQAPEPPPRSDTEFRIAADWPWLLGALLVLAAIGALFLRYGGGVSLALRGGDGAPARSRRQRPTDPSLADAGPGTLDSILRLADRRTALILLARKALATTVAANGVLFQRSWTARDALRHLPRGQGHLDALRALVLASERVQFGGRDVTEEEFAGHLRQVRPLLGPEAA